MYLRIIEIGLLLFTAGAIPVVWKKNAEGKYLVAFMLLSVIMLFSYFTWTSLYDQYIRAPSPTVNIKKEIVPAESNRPEDGKKRISLPRSTNKTPSISSFDNKNEKSKQKIKKNIPYENNKATITGEEIHAETF